MSANNSSQFDLKLDKHMHTQLHSMPVTVCVRMCVRETGRAISWRLAPCLSVHSDHSCLAVVCPLPAVKGHAVGMPTDERLWLCSKINPAL